MSTDSLGSGMYHGIETQGDGVLVDRGGESIIDNRDNLFFSANRGDTFEVTDFESRVGGAFDDERFCFGGDGGGERFQIRGVDFSSFCVD